MRRPEGKPGMIMSRPAMSCPPAWRVIGLCQVDEMALWPGRLVEANPERLTGQPPTLGPRRTWPRGDKEPGRASGRHVTGK